MMYYYWKNKGIRPSVFYNMPEGEKTVLRAFFEQEIEDMKRETPVCPFLIRK